MKTYTFDPSLKWIEEDRGSRTDWECETGLGTYLICRDENVSHICWIFFGSDEWGMHDTPELAKAVCEKHYQETILKCLTLVEEVNDNLISDQKEQAEYKVAAEGAITELNVQITLDFLDESLAILEKTTDQSKTLSLESQEALQQFNEYISGLSHEDFIKEFCVEKVEDIDFNKFFIWYAEVICWADEQGFKKSLDINHAIKYYQTKLPSAKKYVEDDMLRYYYDIDDGYFWL